MDRCAVKAGRGSLGPERVIPETTSPPLTASMAAAAGLSIPSDQVAALAAEQATLRRRADGLRARLRPEDEPGPLDLRPAPSAASLPPQVGPASSASRSREAPDRSHPGSGGQ